MNIKKDDYKRYADARAKKSPIWKNCSLAYLTGGTVCLIGQCLTELWGHLGVEDPDTRGLLTSVFLIFMAILLTGIGVFDKIARHAGAGTLVPITGFANATSSPAIDSRAEGPILGVGAKMFTVSGPVIVYGISAGIVYGVIYFIATCIV